MASVPLLPATILYYSHQTTKLRGLEMADEYLTHTYGDYMKLPPEDKRKIHFGIVEIHGEKIKV